MTEEDADFLLSDAGKALMAEADAQRDDRAETLSALTRLRKAASPEQAAAAWELADLRVRARVKFGSSAASMFFTREALEQASGRRAAAYHARCFADAGSQTVTDLCGGIGGDALAFARAGLAVTLVERDPVRARFAAQNLRAFNVNVIQADVSAGFPSADALWFDPARRSETRRRIVNPDDYSPPLSLISALPDVGVKLAPAVDRDIADEYAAELEWISDAGECKEAILWRGKLQTGDARRATILTDDGPKTLTGDTEAAEVGEIGRWLYEPDPAVIRAGLVGTLAGQIGAAAIDPHIAYLTGDTWENTPFADAYEVLGWLPYHVKKLQAALTDLDAGEVVIKKRGFPLEPEAVRKQLKLRGTQTLTVVLTRRGARHLAILCRPARAGNDGRGVQ